MAAFYLMLVCEGLPYLIHCVSQKHFIHATTTRLCLCYIKDTPLSAIAINACAGSGSSFKNHLTEEQFRWIMESASTLFLPKRCLDAFKKKKVLPFSGPSIASLLTFWGSPLGFIYRAYQTVSPLTGKEWALSKGVTPWRRQLYA